VPERGSPFGFQAGGHPPPGRRENLTSDRATQLSHARMTNAGAEAALDQIWSERWPMIDPSFVQESGYRRQEALEAEQQSGGRLAPWPTSHDAVARGPPLDPSIRRGSDFGAPLGHAPQSSAHKKAGMARTGDRHETPNELKQIAPANFV